MSQSSVSDLEIAVIGVAGRFPGAKNVEEFWHNVRSGVESIRYFTAEELLAAGVDRSLVEDPRYVKASSMLADAELFDASLFEYSPREAELMDPQSRVFLEIAWEAFEDAGLDPRRSKAKVGVFAGQSIGTYLLHNLRHRLTSREFILSASNIRTVLGNGPDFLTTRVAYKLDLSGPAVAVATACSTSLVAVHLACQGLLNGECDAALAGAASVYLPQEAGYMYEDGALLSPDGHCRPFDADASGTLFGRGAGAVVLKPLAAALDDGDRVLAVIKGSAINNDGALRAGFTAPGVTGQSRVVAEAMASADVAADTIGYVEAHGTGTRQGDPIEIAALTQAYRASTDRKGFCAIGSIKSNFGHLDAAAGMAGLIKTMMALRDGVLPPSLNFRTANPQIDFEASPFYVNTSSREWPRRGGPRRAGVSSFGLGGTNAHVVLEEAPEREGSEASERGVEVLVLSAKTQGALMELAGRYEGVVEGLVGADLTDACWTANTGRAQLKQRLAVVGGNGGELAAALGAYRRGEPWTGLVGGRGAEAGGKVAFLCTGQGSQYVGMGRELYRTLGVFREAVDRCAAAVEGELPDLLEAMHPGEGREVWAQERLSETRYTQPALFAVEWALAQVWGWLGVEADVVLGHSSGEFVAASLAGVLSAEEGMRLSLERGRLMQGTSEGVMMAVRAGEAEVAEEVAAEAERGGQVSAAARPSSVTPTRRSRRR